MITSIATATEQQSAAAEQINKSVIDVNRVSDDTATAMSESTIAVSDLARMAENLDHVVKKLITEQIGNTMKYVMITSERLYTWPTKTQKAKEQTDRTLNYLAENYAKTLSKQIQTVLQEKLTKMFRRGFEFAMDDNYL